MNKPTDNIAVVYESKMQELANKLIKNLVKQQYNHQPYCHEFFPTGDLTYPFLETLATNYDRVLIVISPQTKTSIHIATRLKEYQDRNQLQNVYPIYSIK